MRANVDRQPAGNGRGDIRTRRRRARLVWAWLWSGLLGIVFVAVTVLTMSLWVVDPDYTETTPVSDLSFFALGAMMTAGFASQSKGHPPAAGPIQGLITASALALCGLLGGRSEPLAGGALLTAAAAVLLILHPDPRGLLDRHGTPRPAGAVLTVVAAASGLGYAAVMLAAARAAGPSCFLGQCAHGDRLAEMAATAVAIPGLAALAAWRVDGWRLPLWSAGLGALTLGASSVALPHATGSLGALGGTAAIAWGVTLVALGEHDRIRAQRTPALRSETS